jgi:hypothetical protein
VTPASPKLLFDENFGKPLISALKQLVSVCREQVEIAHILDFYSQGQVDDDVWVRNLANDWIVISADRARRRGGPKLPKICAEVGITHALLSSSLHQMKQFEKIRAVLSLWPELLNLTAAAPGSRYSIRKGSSGRPILVEALIRNR